MVTNCLRCLWQSELGVSNWASAAILIASCHWSNRNLVKGFAPFPGTDRTFAGLSTTMIELSSYSKQSSRGVMFLIFRRDAGKVQISCQKKLWWGNCLGRRSNHFRIMTIGFHRAGKCLIGYSISTLRSTSVIGWLTHDMTYPHTHFTYLLIWWICQLI